MIARVLAQQTPLIILDEPTAFLLSTHDLASAISVADRLWVVDATNRAIIEGPAEK